MDIRFPDQEDSFGKTLIQCVLGCLAALALGLFLGHALGAFFGTDESVINTSTYTDRMSAIRTVFTDGDQLDSYSRTAVRMADMEGLKLYTSRNRDKVLALWQGELVDAGTLFDDEIRRSLLEMMNTRDALYGVETAGGSPITDVYLRNVAVSQGVVCYYLYYDHAGYAGLAYDPGGRHLGDSDGALPLTRTEEGVPEWYILYDMGDTS